MQIKNKEEKRQKKCGDFSPHFYAEHEGKRCLRSSKPQGSHSYFLIIHQCLAGHPSQ